MTKKIYNSKKNSSWLSEMKTYFFTNSFNPLQFYDKSCNKILNEKIYFQTDL